MKEAYDFLLWKTTEYILKNVLIICVITMNVKGVQNNIGSYLYMVWKDKTSQEIISHSQGFGRALRPLTVWWKGPSVSCPDV